MLCHASDGLAIFVQRAAAFKLHRNGACAHDCARRDRFSKLHRGQASEIPDFNGCSVTVTKSRRN